MGVWSDPAAFQQALAFGGVGVSTAAVLILLSRLLLQPESRRATRGPFFLLCGHLAMIALVMALPGGTARNSVSVIAALLLLLSIGRSLAVVLLDAILSQRLQRPVPKIFRDIIEGLLYVAAALLTLRAAGVDPGSLLTTSALLTAIIGLSLQDTLGNVFAGLALQTEQPFGLGDWICYDERAEHIGQVVEINWRATKVRTLDQVEMTIPNGQLARASILNYSQPSPLMRRSVHVTVPRHVPPMDVHRVILDALVGCKSVLRTPGPSVVTEEFCDHGIKYWVRFFIDDAGNRETISGEVRERVWYALNRAGIELAVPVRDLMIRPVPDAVATTTATIRERALPLLRGIEFLQDLGEEDLTVLADKSRFLLYVGDEDVVRQGDEGDGLFVCASGEVAVLHDAGRGPTELTRLGHGGLFGELSAMTGEPRAATVRTTRPSELLKLDKASFQAVLGRNPSLAEALSRRLVEKQNQVDAISPEVRKITMGSGTGDHRALLGRIRDFFRL